MPKDNPVGMRLPSLDDIFTSQKERDETDLKKIYEIPLSDIDPFPDHPFKVKDDEDMMNLVESVKANGVLTPATVRKKEDGRYELLSGHRRMRACELAGIEKLRCEIVEMSRDEATVFMVESNFQRTTILPSEKAFAYKMRLDAMKRQGKRTDLTSAQNGRKLETADLVGKEYGESRMQVRRYIRLTELIPDLLDMVDRKRLNFTIAVDISYIDKQTQKWLYEYIHENGFIKPNQITALRKYLNQESSTMTQPLMISILNSVIPIKAPAKKVTLNEPKLMKYFPADYSPKQMEQIIVSLLEQWKNGQEGVDTNGIS